MTTRVDAWRETLRRAFALSLTPEDISDLRGTIAWQRQTVTTLTSVLPGAIFAMALGRDGDAFEQTGSALAYAGLAQHLKVPEGPGSG